MTQFFVSSLVFVCCNIFVCRIEVIIRKRMQLFVLARFPPKESKISDGPTRTATRILVYYQLPAVLYLKR